MTTLSHALAVLLVTLSPGHAAPPLDAVNANVTKLYQRFTACQKIADADREVACLKQLEADANRLYVDQANAFSAFAIPRLTPAHAATIKTMVAAQAEYAKAQCQLSRLLVGPNEVSMRRTHAQCATRIGAESTYGLAVLAGGTLIGVGTADYRALPADATAKLKGFNERLQACLAMANQPERDPCVTQVLADVRAYEESTLKRARAAHAKKTGANALFDVAQKNWSEYRAALCRTTADLRPNPSASPMFHDACLARVTMARLRESLRD